MRFLFAELANGYAKGKEVTIRNTFAAYVLCGCFSSILKIVFKSFL